MSDDTATKLDPELDAILARAHAAFEKHEPAIQLRAVPSAPGSSDDRQRQARHVADMRANGWEARPLRVVQAPEYDEARASSYLAAMRALDDGKRGGIVVLAGLPGSGKTAAACRWAWTRPCTNARFLRAAAFFRSSRYAREGIDGTRDEILRYPALVLDDLGAEYADAAQSYRTDLLELIDAFYADERALVITTNIAYASPAARDALKARGAAVDEAAQTFAERYGEQIVDRLRECGRWVVSAAPSMRGASR